MVGDTGCCGYHFREKGPNLFGLMTLSVPLIILGSLSFVFIRVIRSIIPSLKRTEKQLLVIIKANYQLVHLAAIYPKIRCLLSARVLPYSPRVSGCIYKNYNFIVLSAFWIIIISILKIIKA